MKGVSNKIKTLYSQTLNVFGLSHKVGQLERLSIQAMLSQKEYVTKQYAFLMNIIFFIIH
jgi:hypothetical protein